MKILDRRALGGDLPLQDHRTTWDPFAPQLRACVMAARVEDRDPFWNYVAQGHEDSDHAVKTVGDLLGGFHMQPAKGKRSTGAWSFAVPVITQEANKKPKEKKSAPLATVTLLDVEATRERAKRKVKALPVRDTGWGGDDRFLELTPTVHPKSPNMPKGIPGLVVSGVMEREQHELLLPIMGNTLIAVNAAGDPDLSTLVYDLTADDELDELRNAPLHSFWRVILSAGGCGIEEADVLAWQFGLSGQDEKPGRGLVIDSPGEKLTKPQSQTKPQSDAEVTESQHGQVTFVDEYMARLKRQYQDALNKEAAASGKTFHSQVRPPTADKTRTRPPGPGPASVSEATAVIAALSARVGGPIEVGQAGDPHEIGKTKDGKPINSGHITTDAYYRGLIGDGPQDFEAIPYEQPSGMPFMVPVHLRWDGGVTHKHICGSRVGKWRWESESPIYTGIPLRKTTVPGVEIGDPSEKPPPRPPPPRECQTTPGPVTGGGGYGTDPITVGGTARPSVPGAGMFGLDAGGALSHGLPGSAFGPATGAGTGVGTSLPTGGIDGDGAPTPSGFAEFGLDVGGPLSHGLVGLDGQALPGSQVGGPSSQTRDRQKDQSDYPVLEDKLKIPRGTLTTGGVQAPRGVIELLQSQGFLDAGGKPVDSIPSVGDGPNTLRDFLGGVEAQYPTLAGGTVFGGAAFFKAFATATGEDDLSLGGFIRQHHIDQQVNAPTTAALVGYGQGDGTWKGFTKDPEFSGRPVTGPGGIVAVPPVLATPTRFAEVLAGDYDPSSGDLSGTVDPIRFFFPGSLATVDFANPDQNENGVSGAGGVRLVHTAAGLQLIALEPVDGSELTTPRITFDGEGSFLVNGGDCTVNNGDVVISGGRVEGPESIVFDPQSSDPMAGSEVGLSAGDTAGANEAWWRFDDGSRVDLASLGGGDVELLSTTEDIDFEAIDEHELFTSSADNTVVTKIVIRGRGVDTITTFPEVGVGVAAGEDDIALSRQITGLTTDTSYIINLEGISRKLDNADVVKLGVDVAAVGNTFTADVLLFGHQP